MQNMMIKLTVGYTFQYDQGKRDRNNFKSVITILNKNPILEIGYEKDTLNPFSSPERFLYYIIINDTTLTRVIGSNRNLVNFYISTISDVAVELGFQRDTHVTSDIVFVLSDVQKEITSGDEFKEISSAIVDEINRRIDLKTNNVV